ncbi:hypothetical protein CFOL_v3_28193, partial [Cephalotus follicularis]
GKPIYAYDDPNGLKYWDICDCPKCVYDEEDDQPSSRKKKSSSQAKLQKQYEDGDHFVGLLSEPSIKFDYYIKYSNPKISVIKILEPCTPPKPLTPPPKNPPLQPYS